MLWQSLAVSLLVSIVALVIISFYSYLVDKTISFGGLVISWNANNNIIASIVLPPLLVLIAAIVLVNSKIYWPLNDLWTVGVFILLLRSLLVFLSHRLHELKLMDWVVSGLLSILLCYIEGRLIVYSYSSLRFSSTTVAAILFSFGIVALMYIIYAASPKNFTSKDTDTKLYAKLYLDYYKDYQSLLSVEFKKSKELQRVFFAILITEDLNRPKVFRFFERLFFPLGFIKTTGIMQVTSNHKLTDKSSVFLAQKLIGEYYKDVSKRHTSDYMKLVDIAYLYNGTDGYATSIVYSYFTLTELGAFNGSIANT